MTDTPPPPTLSERALQRLRKIASGNGLEPAAISILETQEQIFTLHAKMEVSPLCETTPNSYPGNARGKDRKKVQTQAALQGAVARHKQEFRESPDWVDAVKEEILSHESKGWGLENAKVTLPHKSAIYSATESCPTCQGRQLLTCTQCNGQGTVICTQCQGQGREQCYYCGGRGENPQQPGQRCTTCNGTKFAPCRFCQTRGHLACPTCNGRKGTPCTTCQGQGVMTQEVIVTCGAETHFQLQSDGLPTGLRRGLDRIGIANLGKGHGDITAESAPEDEEPPSPNQVKFPILIYELALPYAEMRTGFGGKKAVVSALGKRCAITGVPNFLDDTLRPWREKLSQAALGKSALEEALEVRALKEILALIVAGKGRPNEVRKLYPFGLSTEAITKTLSDMHSAVSLATLKTRTIIAALCVGLCTGGFYLLFVHDLHAQLTFKWNAPMVAGADLAILSLSLGASWTLLNFSARFVLQKRFPQLRVALRQQIGKTGYGMVGGIVAAFIAFILMAPVKPLWLLDVLR